jgi:uncharacterized membrane protein
MLILLAHVTEGAEALLDLPPLHPMLVNFTAALVPASVISDLLGWMLRRPALHVVGRWTLLYAAIVTPLTAATGWYWLWTGDHPQDTQMLIHQWLGTVLTVVLAALAIWRWRIYRGDAAPRRSYRIVSVVVLLAMVFQGHVGAIMTFGSGHQPPPDPVHAPEHDHGQEDDGYDWREYIDLS